MIKRITLTSMLALAISFIFARDYKADAISYLKQNPKEFILTAQDITDLKVADQYTDDINITHVWLQQTTNGINLHNGLIGVHFKDGKVFYAAGDVTTDLKSKVNTSYSTVSATKAIEIAAKLMTEKNWSGFKTDGESPDGRKAYAPIAGLTHDPILIKKEYFITNDNQVKLSWEVYIETLSHENAWSFTIDAKTGELLHKLDNVVHCNFDRMFTKPSTPNARYIIGGNPTGSGTNEIISGPAAIETSTYNVYPYNVESPNYGTRQLVSSPDNATASPYGWHDTTGVLGAESFFTLGNNVDAYTDKDDDDLPDAGSRPNGTSTLTYNFPLDLSLRTDTLANIPPVVTQLYYINNIMHDVSYLYGFTETTKNFQKNNYGRYAGTSTNASVKHGNDYVKAEAMDGGGRSNANFAAGTDGTSGRMQMYMFDPPQIRPLLIINAPTSIKDTLGGGTDHGGDDSTGYPAFGPCNFNVTGAIALANDGSTPNPSYACAGYTGTNYAGLTGKIALIRRNECNFFSKITNAQEAGAIGVIVINRVDSLFGGMALPDGEDGNSITIPSLIVPKNIGDKLIANIATANVTLYRNDPDNCSKPAYNGALDNGVMIHEYGHGISNRMTATGSSCLNNLEQAGEGWSDFYALVLTHKATDTRTTPRGIGTYVDAQPFDGPGIRTYPYTTDMAVNPWTYGDVKDMDETPIVNAQGVITGYVPNSAEVHELGELMAVTLWDLYWNLIDKYGYDSNVYAGTAGTSGNARALSIVQRGFTLQKCSPGYLDSRNAIIKAAIALGMSSDTCLIWQTFARRGMGLSAVQGLSSNCNDQTEAFDVPACSTTPTATASFTVSDTVVCAGGTLTFTNTSTASAGSADSVRWTIPGGVPSTSTSTTTVVPTFSTPGTYVISLVAYKSGNASAAVTKSIRVKANPVTAVTSPSICAGSTAQPLASGATTYAWTGGLPAGANPTTPALSTTTTYTVTGTTSGCTSTAVSTVTVTALPNVAVTSPTICAGQTAQPVASGATSYTWTGGLAAVANPTTGALSTTTTYTVTGTTGSCSKTAVSTVTVTALPNVTVTSPGICAGNTAQPVASGATSYTWTGGLAAIANPTTGVLTTTTTYTVTGTTGSCSKTAVSTVTVTTSPTVTVTSPSICSGNTAQPVASGATTYSWTGGLTAVSNPTTGVLTTTTTYTVTGTTNSCTGTAVSTVTVTTSPNVTVTSPGICAGQTAQPVASGATSYTWTGGLASVSNPTTGALSTTTTYTVTGTTGSCSKTAVSTVTVTPTPNVTVNSPGICSGGTATLTANGATSYTWTGGLSGNPATTGTLNTTTTYTVTGTTGSCSATAVATVSVASSLNVTVNSPSICSGTTTNLTANGATSYTWTGSLPSTQSVTTPSLSTTTTYTVTGTSGSCTGTAVATVTVTASPNVTVTSPGICAGQTAQPVASGATSYTWTGGLASISNPTTGALSTTTTYTVTGTTGSCSKTAVSTVSVTASPNVTVNSPSICSGNSTTLTANGATTYTWTGGLSGNPANTGSLSGTATYTVTGTTGSCTGTAVSVVTVSPTPATPGITQSGDTLYTNVIIVGASYSWYKGGVLQSSGSSPYYHITSTGSYTVKVTDGSCPSAESAAFPAVYTGVKNATNSIKVFEVYPNPTEGRLVLNLNLTKSSNVQIHIYTPEGRELYVKTFTSTRNVFEEVNIYDYAKGVYIIKLNVDEETYYHKVVKD